MGQEHYGNAPPPEEQIAAFGWQLVNVAKIGRGHFEATARRLSDGHHVKCRATSHGRALDSLLQTVLWEERSAASIEQPGRSFAFVVYCTLAVIGLAATIRYLVLG